MQYNRYPTIFLNISLYERVTPCINIRFRKWPVPFCQHYHCVLKYVTVTHCFSGPNFTPIYLPFLCIFGYLTFFLPFPYQAGKLSTTHIPYLTCLTMLQMFHHLFETDDLCVWLKSSRWQRL